MGGELQRSDLPREWVSDRPAAQEHPQGEGDEQRRAGEDQEDRAYQLQRELEDHQRRRGGFICRLCRNCSFRRKSIRMRSAIRPSPRCWSLRMSSSRRRWRVGW